MQIYMLGIGGVAMGNLANLLKAAGHQVTGSDAAIYPPMSDFLKSAHIPYLTPFSPSNIPAKVDLAVIGNVISRGHPEMLAIQERQIPYLSLPQTIAKYLLPGKEPIVITGTHGKTTTTSMMTHCLRQVGCDPGYLIGGIANNLGTGSGLGGHGSRPFFVLEGDEYDSAFFQKEPKFLSYLPKYVVLTSLEFDHADIYADLAAIVHEFNKLVKLIPSTGHLLVCSDYTTTLEVAQQATAPVYTYGRKPTDDFYLATMQLEQASAQFELVVKSTGKRHHFKLGIGGEYNVMNATAVAASLLLYGFSSEKIAAGLLSFRGVQRRQQSLFSNSKINIIEDFAHHPTAIAATLKDYRQRYPDAEIWALFEPRSNTMRRRYFQDSLPDALAMADQVVLYKVYNAAAIAPEQRLDRQAVAAKIQAKNKKCWLPEGVEEIVEWLIAPSQKFRLVVLMSNGDIDGLKPLLLRRLQS